MCGALGFFLGGRQRFGAADNAFPHRGFSRCMLTTWVAGGFSHRRPSQAHVFVYALISGRGICRLLDQIKPIGPLVPVS